MAEIDSEIISRATDMYDPKFRYLQSAKVNGMVYTGHFSVSEHPQNMEPSEEKFDHITRTEMSDCVNQLVFTSAADMMYKKQFKEFGADDFSRLQRNNIVASSLGQQYFKRKIPRGEFDGSMTIKSFNDRGGVVRIKYSVDFANGSMIIDDFGLYIMQK